MSNNPEELTVVLRGIKSCRSPTVFAIAYNTYMLCLTEDEARKIVTEDYLRLGNEIYKKRIEDPESLKDFCNKALIELGNIYYNNT